ncbi:MAG: GNAT family N-acetyltransferase [Parvularculaceae bacterium]|jgi:ribosomal-protein-alanine N-acetyltransferase|nr:GNAT family N-acetyltransferase [Parvularculaceae bacterium]
MAFIDIAVSPPSGPIIQAGPVLLRPAQYEDYFAWKRLREKSRAHLTAWEQDWTENEMTPQAFRLRVRSYWREMKRGTAAAFLVVGAEGEALVGGITLSNIRYGASCSGMLGYWIGVDYLRRGYGQAAVEGLLDHAFGRLGLHRVEAACQPANEASKRLLLSAGFRQEGFAREYLRINGAWRDHLLFAATHGTPA